MISGELSGITIIGIFDDSVKIRYVGEGIRVE